MGLNLKNPIIAASSGLTDSVDGIVSLEKSGVSAVVLKSIFEEEIISELDANMKKMASESFLYPETLEFYEELEQKTISDQYLELIKAKASTLRCAALVSRNSEMPTIVKKPYSRVNLPSYPPENARKGFSTVSVTC